MNILMALSQLEVTGAEVYATTLADALIEKGNNVFIVSDTLTKKTKATYIPIPFNKRSVAKRLSHVKLLLKIIKEHDIQIVHANSRASSWSCALACSIANIPLITTTHGRQPVHLSRKLIKAFGQRSICVCENIQNHIANDLGYEKDKTILIRNPIDTSLFKSDLKNKGDDFVISIIGRLSGPKGDVVFDILNLLKNSPYKINVIGGKEITERFSVFKNSSNINFIGYVNNVNDYIKSSDLVIGAGRVAVEAILSKRAVIAVGESQYEGLVTKNTIKKALASNFGDIGTVKGYNCTFDTLLYDIEKAKELDKTSFDELFDIVNYEFSKDIIVDRIERLYQREYVLYKKYEIPVIMYHRVIEDKSEAGIHGTYITKEKFESHLKYLKDNGYQTVTFKDLVDNKYKERFNKGNKFIILTFDDGYIDNYKVAFPLLKKYGHKCVIYLVSDLNYNRWDCESNERNEKKLDLMSIDMLKEMQDYGIEFGCHTKTHPRLSKISIEDVIKEINESKETLETRLNTKMVSFAYPYGDLSEDVKYVASRAGFDFSVATDSGDIAFSTDIHQIRRIGIFPGNSFSTFKRKVSGKYNFRKIKRELKEKSK